MPRRVCLLLIFFTLLLSGCFGGGTPVTLEIATIGEGTVIPSQKNPKKNSVVTLQVLPEENWYFDRFDGRHGSQVSFRDGHYELLMDSGKRITAIFREIRHTVEIRIEGEGVVNQELLTQSTEYLKGSRVRLTALPKEGYVFEKWSGAREGTTNPLDVTVDQDLVITAHFVRSVPSSVLVVGPSELLIPARGGNAHEASYALWVFDQFGFRIEEAGFTFHPTWSLKDPVLGVRSHGQVLTITDEAVPGNLVLEVHLEYYPTDKPEEGGYLQGERLVHLIYGPSVPAQIRFTTQDTTISLPGTHQAPAVVPLRAMVFDQYNRPMPEHEVLFSLPQAVAGVSLENKNLLVTSSARPGTFTLIATAQGVGGVLTTSTSIQLVFGASIPYSLVLTGPKEVDIPRVDPGFIEVAYQATLYDQYLVPMQRSLRWELVPSVPGVSIENGRLRVLHSAVPRNYTLRVRHEGHLAEQTVTLNPPPILVSLVGTFTVEHAFPRSVVDKEGTSSQGTEEGVATPDYSLAESVENELVLRYSETIDPTALKQELEKRGFVILDEIGVLRALLVQTPSIGIQSSRDLAEEIPGILQAEENFLAHTASVVTPNDPHYGKQWHYPQMRLPQAWSVTTGDSALRIAVLDTGIDHTHPDLEDRVDIAHGYNFIGNNTDAMDDHWHGTHVAGTIGATTNNNIGVAGVMWDVTLVPVKVLNQVGTGTFWTISQGILFAAGLLDEVPNPYPADVLNLSLGASSGNSLLYDAVVKAHLAGHILVCATGNSYSSSIMFPARYPETLAVGAVDFNYPHTPKRAPYSNYGAGLDLVAPGGDIHSDSNHSGIKDGVFSTYPNQEYRPSQGTSMAAPHVSGLIGLMLSAGIPRYEVVDILKHTTMRLTPEDYSLELGYGLIHAYFAVNNVRETRILVGKLENGVIVPIVETAVPSVKDGQFFLPNVRGTHYRVFAWIDVRGNGILEAGDYLAMSELIFHEEDGHYEVPPLVLREIEKTP